MLRKDKETISTQIKKEFDVILPTQLANDPNLHNANISIDENQIVLQIPSENKKLPTIWAYVHGKATWSVIRFSS